MRIVLKWSTKQFINFLKIRNLYVYCHFKINFQFKFYLEKVKKNYFQPCDIDDRHTHTHKKIQEKIHFFYFPGLGNVISRIIMRSPGGNIPVNLWCFLARWEIEASWEPIPWNQELITVESELSVLIWSREVTKTF